jgi:hypothetical protein
MLFHKNLVNLRTVSIKSQILTFFCGTENWIQGFVLAREVLYHLINAPSSFASQFVYLFVFFQIGYFTNFALIGLNQGNPFTSPFWVSGITDVISKVSIIELLWAYLDIEIVNFSRLRLTKGKIAKLNI